MGALWRKDDGIAGGQGGGDGSGLNGQRALLLSQVHGGWARDKSFQRFHKSFKVYHKPRCDTWRSGPHGYDESYWNKTLLPSCSDRRGENARGAKTRKTLHQRPRPQLSVVQSQPSFQCGKIGRQRARMFSRLLPSPSSPRRVRRSRRVRT